MVNPKVCTDSYPALATVISQIVSGFTGQFRLKLPPVLSPTAGAALNGTRYVLILLGEVIVLSSGALDLATHAVARLTSLGLGAHLAVALPRLTVAYLFIEVKYADQIFSLLSAVTAVITVAGVSCAAHRTQPPLKWLSIGMLMIR